MNHSEMRLLVSALVDGELGADQARLVRKHLEECAECRSFERSMAILGDDIRLAADYVPRSDFVSRVLRGTQGERGSSWFPAEQVARRLVLGLSVLAMVFVGLSAALQPEDPVLMGPYLSGEPTDTSAVRSLLTKETLSKEDVLIAALTRN